MTIRGHTLYFMERQKKRFQKFLFKKALLCAFKKIQKGYLNNIKEYVDEELVYNIIEAILF